MIVHFSNQQNKSLSLQKEIQSTALNTLQIQTKKDDLIDYAKIKISLSEVKTKLNSKVAPRISDIASNMYAQITKGKYQHIEVSNDFDFLSMMRVKSTQ